ncbi:MAG: hypothetical protein TREMPRED_000187 [Tremellales sp. Tagirdzhanova-0007]|nr:MAG: hypothetical protein TREMPRED_000187 [Tremellales sp. Tagirdzhanova-0007]
MEFDAPTTESARYNNVAGLGSRLPKGRRPQSEAERASKAAVNAAENAAKNAVTCVEVRAKLVALLAEHGIGILDMLSILLCKFPGEVEDKSVGPMTNRHVSRWLKGDYTMQWPHKEDSTLWDHILDTLMRHEKNKEGRTTHVYQVRWLFHVQVTL